MTNSLNLSPKNKIVFFHGLNNNTECWDPMRKHFEGLGFETEMVVLPLHGENRYEASDWKGAVEIFAKKMEKFRNTSYYAIAFSHGAMYLEWFLETATTGIPLKQVLLAPALYIRNQKIIEKVLPKLPSKVLIPSLAPKPLRRYNILSAGEYMVLVQKIVEWQKIRGDKLKVPTKMMIDPKDELVDAKALVQHFDCELIERPYLKKGLGSHHIIFHPDYFTSEHWKSFLSEIESFFTDHSNVGAG